MSESELPLLLTAKQAVALVGLSDKTLLRATYRGEPTGRVRVGGHGHKAGTVRYRRSELVAWAAEAGSPSRGVACPA